MAGRKIFLPVAGRSADARAQVIAYAAQRLELTTHNAEPGLLVVSEIFYRGWEAYGDGARVPLERVDFALRGVAMPPGGHHVAFFFRAPSFRLGALLSSLGSVGLLLGALLARRKRTRLRLAAAQ